MVSAVVPEVGAVLRAVVYDRVRVVHGDAEDCGLQSGDEGWMSTVVLQSQVGGSR